MAEMGFRLYILFLLLSLMGFSTVLSRTLIEEETPKTTTTLDISTSLKQTIDLLSFNPESTTTTTIDQTLHEEKKPKPISSSSSSSSSIIFSLQLHSRDTLHKSSHKDYKSLTQSRFKRDSARVRSLLTKLDLAINGIKKSDLKPLMDEEVDSKSGGGNGGLEGPIISGTSQGSGEYFSRVGIGRPPKPFYMVLDTGSDVTWVQCAPCTDCYQQTDPIYEPASSTSYSSLSCDTQQCKSLDVSACRNESCLYQVSYGDGSYTVGDFVTETLTFGDSASDTASVEKVAIGCGHDNEGLFVGSAGLFGLGGGSLSFPSQVKASSFSYCLVDRDSTSTSRLEFGHSDSNSVNAVTAPLLRNRQLDTFYYVGLTGMSVGGEMLSIPPSLFEMDESGNGGVIIDSGTAVTRLQSDAYNSLRDAFVKGTTHLPSSNGVALFDTCYDLSSMNSVDVPTVTLHFPDGKSLGLPAKNYLIPVDSGGTFCFAFAPTTSSLSIIGNVQQQGTRVSFDIDNSVVGFSPNKC